MEASLTLISAVTSALEPMRANLVSEAIAVYTADLRKIEEILASMRAELAGHIDENQKVAYGDTLASSLPKWASRPSAYGKTVSEMVEDAYTGNTHGFAIARRELKTENGYRISDLAAEYTELLRLRSDVEKGISIESKAAKYAETQIAWAIAKISGKLAAVGEVVSSTVGGSNPNFFQLTLNLPGGTIVGAWTSRRLNYRGRTMFNQWPTLLYVNGRRVTEKNFAEAVGMASAPRDFVNNRGE